MAKDGDGNCIACDDDKVFDVATSACTDNDCAALTGCDKHACFNTTTSVCLECDDDYALTATGTCATNNVDNCRVGGTTAAACTMCDPFYYDVNGTSCDSSSIQETMTIVQALISIFALLI